jgi:hypothetical protein
MEQIGKMDAIKGKGRDISSRLLIIAKILIVGLAVFGAFTLVGEVSAFFDGTGLEPIYEVPVANITKIMVDTDGDTNFDIQIAVESLSAFKDLESDQVFLAVMGNSSNLGQ